MATDDLAQRAPRRSTRDEPRSTRSRSHSRSASVSSRSSHSRSRSRPRERASNRRRSRSRSESRRASRRASRRSHRSQSRSASRGRSSRRDRRRRERSRSRERSRRNGSGRSRKRSRRDRDRSRSTEGRRRRRRDSSEDGGRDRRQRRRRNSDASARDKLTEATKAPAVPTVQDELKTKPVEQNVVMSSASQEKHDTPTSQESVATTMATATASSQSDTETAVKETLKFKETTKEEEQETAPAASSTASTKASSTALKVDVKSIKLDILKALADARSTIAGIKGAASTAVKAADATKAESPVPDTHPKPDEKLCASSSSDESTQSPQPTINNEQPQPPQAPNDDEQPLPPPETKMKPMSPQKPHIASADVDEFDMFSAAELHGAGMALSPAAAPAAVVVDSAVQSNYDDADGYYKPNIGEVLNGTYRILGTVGKGVFSTVLRCQRINSTSEDTDIVAIKLIRNNDIMREAAETEIKILTLLSERDPRDKKHCVRLLERFEHRNHVALVFESMQMNVREAMKKFGGKGGISIQAVRIFCRHLLVALSHLDACGIVHADIKPDNVLLDEKQTMIKLCDFGSAFESNHGKHDPTPYLVSRFYRAPEIVLGLPYDKAVDMWSVGCCLYEMFTGKVMFPGATNNEMLKLFMELKGKVPNKIIKKHRQAYIEQFQMEPHFTEDNKFCSHEIDRVTGKPVLRLMDAIKTRFDLGGALLSAKSSTDDRKQVLELRNLLERMFTLDASKRITPKEALAHPFVKTEGKQAT